MSKEKFDLKNSDRFKARVKKLEGNQFIKLINDPVSVNLNNGITAWVAAIGQNDSYLVVELVDTTSNDPIIGVTWTKGDGKEFQPEDYHDKISNIMLNWLMLHSEESDFKKIKPSDLNVMNVALQTVAAKMGKEALGKSKMIRTLIQGVAIDVQNPFHE